MTQGALEEASKQNVAVASFDITPREDLVTQVSMAQTVLPNGFADEYVVTIFQNILATIEMAIGDLGYTISA